MQLPQHPSQLINRVFDSMFTFELHISNMARAISSKLGIFRKCKKIYEDDITRRCFFSFILPHFEYCSSVWLSAADSHLRLLDRSIKFLLSDLNLDIGHRRVIGVLSVLYKIVTGILHPLCKFLPDFYQPARITRSSMTISSVTMLVDRL